MIFRSKTMMVLVAASLLLAPLAFVLFPGVGVVQAAGQSRAPNVIATTLAFFDGKVVTVQYSNIYFCNSAGPATSSTSSPCVVGTDATTDPVPDRASNTLNVIVPFFATFSDGTPNNIFNAALGANNFTQCPDNTVSLTCPNHPNFLDLTPTMIAGVVHLPIHSHVLNTSAASTNQGGWWKLKVWLVVDPKIWPNPSTGACTSSGSCVTSISALESAASSGKAVGPVLTTIYLFFNVVSSSAQ